MTEDNMWMAVIEEERGTRVRHEQEIKTLNKNDLESMKADVTISVMKEQFHKGFFLSDFLAERCVSRRECEDVIREKLKALETFHKQQ